MGKVTIKSRNTRISTSFTRGRVGEKFIDTGHEKGFKIQGMRKV